MDDDMDVGEDEDDKRRGVKEEKSHTRAAASTGEEEDTDRRIEIRADYAPSLASAESAGAARGAGNVFIDPRTGRAVAEHRVSDHVRIGLIDPQWQRDQSRAKETARDTPFALGDVVAENLQRLAQQRTDIVHSAGAKRPAEDDQQPLAKRKK
jgi:Pre-mRNA splicing factor PRP21 like protein